MSPLLRDGVIHFVKPASSPGPHPWLLSLCRRVPCAPPSADVSAAAWRSVAAAGFDEIEHSSGVAIPRPSEDCTEPSWLIEAERILFETSAFASNLEGSAFERADDVPDIAADHVSLLGSTSPSPSTPPDKRRETSDVNRTAELVTSGVCDISGPPPRVSTEWSVPSLHGVLWIFTVLLVVATIPFAVAVSGPVPASMPLPDAISIDVPLPDIISINGACHLALTGPSASARPPGRPPGNQPSINNFIAGAETRRNSTSNSTSNSNLPPCPSPKQRPTNQLRPLP
ncbi:hypothetical protein EMIHUDRAFT_240385 [Emiliania huxleyi CCMP1516]|uniref:Uncharacterized protein n=2 Tax=Emiliania huxleyi TaxID=2903 RepID=A0A0D3JFZ5_EMIH1|nr:hypothetical protein EMIHUDRAFT_240385 [Emiliania huxleyi CCMP1516]EOD22430.1 hypothetical protein EMIHUDRAFT_240385 [Emiliania huxleyi CCMP1516]|eukprot:XP_005774859.1 hypothetical protein EMIHUDRAFT_240385 [Emiliania huxleyi CCMP1516]